MFLNSVFFDIERNALFRIVYQGIDHLWIFNLTDKSSWPEFIDLCDYEDNLYLNIFYIEKDPYPTQLHDITENDIRIRDEAYNAISILLDGTNAMFLQKERNVLIKQAMEHSGRPRIYIIRQLKRYWQRGLSRNALLPDFKNSGAKGVSRRNGKNVNGRKREYSGGEPVYVTDEIALLFEKTLKKYYIKENSEETLQQVYDNRLLGTYRSKYPTQPDEQVPTFDQFKYFYSKNFNRNEVIKKRADKKIRAKDLKDRTSTAANMNVGPGHKYEIDATVGNVYLVSERDRSLIIGRPTVYFVYDVFSRMIVGMYVGLENPSWPTAMIAIANAFVDKTSFCAEYDIKITSEEWPSVGFPISMVADKGEVFSKQADVLENYFDVFIVNNPAHRPDLKGGVESQFLVTQAQYEPYLDGVVESINGKKRLGYDYREKANLTLAEFTKIMILIVLQRNNFNVLERYDFAEDMPDNLPAIPIKLWNWGMKHRVGNLKNADNYDEKTVKINLLPLYDKATVSDEGIKFNGLRYNCSEAMRRGWFDKIRRKTRPKKVTISFDPRRTNTIYIRPDGNFNNFWECNLSDKSRKYRGMSFAEAAKRIKNSKKVAKQGKQDESLEASKSFKKMQDTTNNAKAEESKLGIKNKSTKNITKNREEEKIYERDKLYNESENTESATIHELFPSDEEDYDDYGYGFPSLDNFMDELDDQ